MTLRGGCPILIYTVLLFHLWVCGLAEKPQDVNSTVAPCVMALLMRGSLLFRCKCWEIYRAWETSKNCSCILGNGEAQSFGNSWDFPFRSTRHAMFIHFNPFYRSPEELSFTLCQIVSFQDRLRSFRLSIFVASRCKNLRPWHMAFCLAAGLTLPLAKARHDFGSERWWKPPNGSRLPCWKCNAAILFQHQVAWGWPCHPTNQWPEHKGQHVESYPSWSLKTKKPDHRKLGVRECGVVRPFRNYLCMFDPCWSNDILMIFIDIPSFRIIPDISCQALAGVDRVRHITNRLPKEVWLPLLPGFQAASYSLTLTGF